MAEELGLIMIEMRDLLKDIHSVLINISEITKAGNNLADEEFRTINGSLVDIQLDVRSLHEMVNSRV